MTDPIPEPPHREPTPLPDLAQAHAAVSDLCGELCEAVGVDPDTNQGFRLTVFAGQVPQLEVFPLVDGPGENDWAAPLGQAMAGSVLAVLPGRLGTAPPVEVRPELLPVDKVPSQMRPDQAAARLLPMLADVLNGASCDAELRAWMTGTAEALAALFTNRVCEMAHVAAEATRANLEAALAAEQVTE